ncbi:DUF6017 domain-containing protein [bacterium]|nr:DUF6017 domain-containing protein [bacterium]
MQKIQFDYFRGMEAEQYSFYRVPKVLFTAECFKSLSCEAKVLYGLMLDRMSLSTKNRWFDDEDRVYIIFTVDEIAELMNCGTQKAVKLIKELDTSNGIGLIEKKRLGLGKPNVIYVKNFMIKEIPNQLMKTDNVQKQEEYFTEETVMRENAGKIADMQAGDDFQEEIANLQKQEEERGKSAISQNCENHHSKIVKITNQEFPESQFNNYENQNSGMMKMEIQEFPKSQSNKTDINNTDFRETDIIQSYQIQSGSLVSHDKRNVIEEMKIYRELIQERIEYKYHEQEDVDELVELMVEVMMMPDDSTIRIAGVDKPVALVKNRFMKLNYSHIEYVLFCLHRNTTKVGNIKAYLLTTLYNAPLTISNYYQAEVNHDMYGGG